MNHIRSDVVTGVFLASALTLSVACGAASAAEGAGGLLQQLEKNETTHTFKEQKPPEVKQEEKKPVVEEHQGGPKVFVKRFRLEGNTLISDAELLSDVVLDNGKEMTLDEIKGVADSITAKYRARGYLIVNAYVPSQTIFDGAVISKKKGGYAIENAFGAVLIKVVEGTLGAITVRDNHHYSASFIKRYLETARTDPSLKQETLEKALLLLNEYPSLSVRTTLSAGKEPGTTDINATATDSRPLSGTVSYDNFGVKSTGKNRLSASLNAGNAITSGDMIKLNGIIGIDRIDPLGLSYGRAEYIVPAGGFGTQIGAYYSNTVYRVGGNDSLAVLKLNGSATVAGIYATHPLLKTFEQSLKVRAGGEYISLYDHLLGSTQDNDEIRKITATISYELLDRFKGRNFINFGYARGLGGFLGGTKQGTLNPGPSYSGAGNTFDKFTLDAIRVQKLPGYTYLMASGNFQYSPDRLFSAERMQLGGEGSVRGVNPATTSGDSGYFTSLELVASPFYPETELFKQKLGNMLKLALFTDYGGVSNTSPRPQEHSSSTLSSVGVGVRLYGGTLFSCKLDWAVPSTHGAYNDFRVSESQVYVQAIVSF
ncbi:MAG: ShlB/FhaC/HecB family hemolysin secretion/activation protein [Desulfuromonadaceae bacterium]|nr:ShlB/FhaC/HecB family hemolysin secretion/activation protein [Desulfuromonadaceae bacterium]